MRSKLGTHWNNIELLETSKETIWCKAFGPQDLCFRSWGGSSCKGGPWSCECIVLESVIFHNECALGIVPSAWGRLRFSTELYLCGAHTQEHGCVCPPNIRMVSPYFKLRSFRYCATVTQWTATMSRCPIQEWKSLRVLLKSRVTSQDGWSCMWTCVVYFLSVSPWSVLLTSFGDSEK